MSRCVEKRALTSHEEVVGCQERVVDKMHAVQLSVELQDLLASLGHLEEHKILVLAIVDSHYRRASDVRAGGAKHALESGRHDETLSVQHDDSLPVVELQEERRELHAGIHLGGSRVFPLLQAPVNVGAPGTERLELDEERRGQLSVHELIALVCATRPCLLGLTVLQDLQDLGLQQPQAEVVIGHDLVGWPLQVRWRVEEALFCDEAIVKQ